VVGCPVDGAKVGLIVVGEKVGLRVGEDVVGSAVAGARVVGDSVGLVLGRSVGMYVGSSEGIPVDGDSVGPSVLGSNVGLWVSAGALGGKLGAGVSGTGSGFRPNPTPRPIINAEAQANTTPPMILVFVKDVSSRGVSVILPIPGDKKRSVVYLMINMLK
jgi:hypothetical protein